MGSCLVPIFLTVLAVGGSDHDRIDTILEQLEARGATVNDLECRVEYTVEDVLADDKFTKFGQIRYKHQEPNPWFYIHFAKTHQGGIVLGQGRREWYIFKGRYLWEIK